MSRPAEAALETLREAGLNLCGVLSASGYDELVPPAWRCAQILPPARSVLVLASGGRVFFERFEASPEASDRTDPLDHYTRRVVFEAADRLDREGSRARPLFYFERRDGAFADFAALAQACGLGVPSRLRILLNPRYGPWLAIRALLVTEVALAPSPPIADFAPCDGCPAPCAVACHGAALDAGLLSVVRCRDNRRRDPRCELRCDARRACVVGPEHAYPDRAEAHHMRASLAWVRALDAAPGTP